MEFGDTVYVIVNGEVHEGELRGIYYNDGNSFGVWMPDYSPGPGIFKMFTFYAYEIFTDIMKAKRALFKIKLGGRYVKA